jgi:hypothetical protein
MVCTRAQFIIINVARSTFGDIQISVRIRLFQMGLMAVRERLQGMMLFCAARSAFHWGYV